MSNEMYIKQISVFLENKEGTLASLLNTLGDAKINLLALCLADTADFGIARIITASNCVDKALEVLRENNFMASVSDLVCVQLPHEPNGLARIAQVLGDSGVSLEYAYSFCQSTLDDAVIIIRPQDNEKCIEILNKEGVTLVTQQQVDKF